MGHILLDEDGQYSLEGFHSIQSQAVRCDWQEGCQREEAQAMLGAQTIHYAGISDYQSSAEIGPNPELRHALEHIGFYLLYLLAGLCILAKMPAFQSKTFRRETTASSSFRERLGAVYRARLPRHPFLLFGLPFIAIIVAGSFALTPAAAIRYERHDRKVQQLSQEEALQLGLKGPDGESIKRNPRRRIIGDEREEYYVRTTHRIFAASVKC